MIYESTRMQNSGTCTWVRLYDLPCLPCGPGRRRAADGAVYLRRPIAGAPPPHTAALLLLLLLLQRGLLACLGLSRQMK